MLTLVFTILPLAFAAALLASVAWEYLSWKDRFANWSYGGARSLGAVKKHGDVGPRLAFEYNVDGTTYQGLSRYMKDTLPPKGERIDIYYDPQNPADAEWYSSGLHKSLMVGTALIALLIFWLAI